MRLCLILSVVVWATPARAQLHFAGEAPRVFTVEPRQHLFGHEIALGFGVLPLDAFYVGLAPQVGYTYRFNDLWSWEVAHGLYAIDVDTPLRGELQRAAATADNRNQEIRVLATSSVVVTPMYGKIAAFNAARAQVQTSFQLGVGVANTDKATGVAVDLGASINFWAARAFSIRFDVRDYLVFTSLSPQNILLLGLAGSFHFSLVTAEAAPYAG